MCKSPEKYKEVWSVLVSGSHFHTKYDKLPAWLQKTADSFQAGCPVCREPIKDEADSLKCAMPPAELQNAPEFKLTRELRELQQKMANLLLQQKSRSAIIDVEAESDAVISIETEEEMRRRMQRKHNETASAMAENISANTVSANGGECDSPDSSKALATGQQRDIGACSKPSNSNNFSPVVQQTHRVGNDHTNNNYQHNRRHYRGGRTHQHRHHHQRDREARYEANHTASYSKHCSANCCCKCKWKTVKGASS